MEDAILIRNILLYLKYVISIRAVVTTRKCGVVIRSVASVCLSVCPVQALTSESLHLQISF